MTIKKKFLKDCEAFIVEMDVLATDFGKASANNGKLMTRIRADKSCTADTMDAVYAYMKKERGNKRRREKYKAAKKA